MRVQYLVDSDGHERASLNGGDGTSRECVLCVLPNIDIASQLCSPTFVDNVCRDLGISDNSCVLLARTDSCTITCNTGVD